MPVSFTRWRLLALTVLCAWLAMAAGLAAADGSAKARTINWDELVPKDWDPMKGLSVQNIDLLNDGDPRAVALMRELRKAWDAAPVRSELEGQRVRLPGYVVPLQQAAGLVSEFLLVPYYGACIHTPPPPANQIVHVALDKPLPLRSMEAVWASGTLRARRIDAGLGTSGYALEGLQVEPYKASTR